MLLDETHWNCFRQNFPNQPVQGEVGNCPSSYLKYKKLQLPSKYSKLENRALNRSEVRKICQDGSIDVLASFSCVMAWGGQRRDHYKKAIENKHLPEIIGLLIKGIPREAAFNFLNDLYLSKKLTGIGIAFFTKLIYFFGSKQNGFILDQWTSKSSALLCVSPPVRIGKTRQNGKTIYFPEKDTTGAEYEKFCCFIEHLADKLGWNADATEVALFGKGTAWRKHIEKHFPKK
jgi:Putative 8-oxoguanine DNA glycosylase OGG-like protein